MMSECKRAQAHLNDFLDGTLNAARSEAVQVHLNQCKACRQEYDAYRAMLELLRTARVPYGGASRQRIIATFRSATMASEAARRPVRSWRLWLVPSGVTALAAAFCLFVLHPRSVAPILPTDSSVMKLLTASSREAAPLPGPGELDEMTSMHAVQSFTVRDGSAEAQEDALADATSRLHSRSD